MKITQVLLVAISGVVCFATMAPAAAADDAATIRAGTQAWLKAFNRGDADAVAALYADDAVVMPPAAPLVRGRTAVKQFFTKEVAAAQAAGVAFAFGEVNEVGVSHDLAWHSGTYTVKDKSGATVDSGKYLEAWRKTAGKWRLVRDIWNSDAAPPTAAPAAAPRK